MNTAAQGCYGCVQDAVETQNPAVKLEIVEMGLAWAGIAAITYFILRGMNIIH
jgi:hypothetical protein